MGNVKVEILGVKRMIRDAVMCAIKLQMQNREQRCEPKYSSKLGTHQLPRSLPQPYFVE